jgi:hypothetical protein
MASGKRRWRNRQPAAEPAEHVEAQSDPIPTTTTEGATDLDQATEEPPEGERTAEAQSDPIPTTTTEGATDLDQATEEPLEGERTAEHRARRRISKRTVVTVGVLTAALVVAIAAVAALAVPWLDSGANGTNFVDNFDRAYSATSLGTGPGRVQWHAVNGVWGIQDHTGVVSRPSPRWSIAVVDGRVADQRVSTTVANVVPGQGLAFRVEDENNFFALVALPKYATWNLYRVQHGQAASITNTGLSAAKGRVSIAIVVKGDTISLFIDGSLAARITTSALAGATQAGLVQFGTNGGFAQWTNFSIRA